MRNTLLAALAAVALAGGTGCVGMHGMGCAPQMPCGAACGDCTSCGSCDAGCTSCESTWDGYCQGESCGLGACATGACTTCNDGCGPCGGLFAKLHAKHAGGLFSLHHKKHRNHGCDDGLVNGAGAVVYPYYTTRGPRDFLACEPRTIGR